MAIWLVQVLLDAGVDDEELVEKLAAQILLAAKVRVWGYACAHGAHWRFQEHREDAFRDEDVRWLDRRKRLSRRPVRSTYSPSVETPSRQFAARIARGFSVLVCLFVPFADPSMRGTAVVGASMISGRVQTLAASSVWSARDMRSHLDGSSRAHCSRWCCAGATLMHHRHPPWRPYAHSCGGRSRRRPRVRVVATTWWRPLADVASAMLCRRAAASVRIGGVRLARAATRTATRIGTAR